MFQFQYNEEMIHFANSCDNILQTIQTNLVRNPSNSGIQWNVEHN